MMIEEGIIFVGIAFWLIYFAQTFENNFIKLFLKLFSSLIIIIVSYVPLVEVSLANQDKIYDLFAWSITNGMIFFFVLWFVILIYESFLFFLDNKKNKLNIEK